MTEEQRAVLAHVVIDPDAWYANAIAALGEARGHEALEAKVSRWRPAYEEAAADPNYQTRAEREAEE